MKREVPAEVRGWNWGAFILNVAWGFGNKAYLALFCFIPGFNLIWMFVCGFKGNEWAWQANPDQDLATFLAVQKSWNRAGLIQFIITLAVVVLWLVMFMGLASFALVNNN